MPDTLEIMIRLPIVLLALTGHEFAHAYVALRMGDPTAYRLGRCTLNPLKHLDPLGTLALIFAPIGWAKPVPVNSLNFHDQRMGNLLTTLAGPVSNILQAISWGLVCRGLGHVLISDSIAVPNQVQMFLTIALVMAGLAVQINVGLAVFNLLPIYPLDGFHVTLNLLKPPIQERFAALASFGPFLLLGLIIVDQSARLGILYQLIYPPVELIMTYVAGVDAWRPLFGLPSGA